MKFKRKIIWFFTVLISFATLAICFSGCSSITVDGKKLKSPDQIDFFRVALYSYNSSLTKKRDIEEVFSLFDGAEFVLSEEGLTENDGNVHFEETLYVYYGENTYWISVAENGRAEFEDEDKVYVTEEGAVDYAALHAYADEMIRKYFESIPKRGN